VAHRPRHSVEFDEDALRLYEMAFELHGWVQPDWRSIREAPIGIRGEELHRQKYGPIIPAHEDPSWSRWTHASSEFKRCFNREPIAGDLLRWEQAVMFLGLVDGKNACRPATDDELRRPESDEFFREIWCREPTNDPPPGRVWIRDKRNGFFGTIPVESLAAATEGPDPQYTKCGAAI
jgi:hypothetical protein